MFSHCKSSSAFSFSSSLCSPVSRCTLMVISCLEVESHKITLNSDTVATTSVLRSRKRQFREEIDSFALTICKYICFQKQILYLCLLTWHLSPRDLTFFFFFKEHLNWKMSLFCFLLCVCDWHLCIQTGVLPSFSYPHMPLAAPAPIAGMCWYKESAWIAKTILYAAKRCIQMGF